MTFVMIGQNLPRTFTLPKDSASNNKNKTNIINQFFSIRKKSSFLLRNTPINFSDKIRPGISRFIGTARKGLWFTSKNRSGRKRFLKVRKIN